jgi:hypothetical protein
MFRYQLGVLLAVAVSRVAAADCAPGDYRCEVGYTSLQARLGAALPLGDPIPVLQVEAPFTNGSYLPDVTNAEFVGAPTKTFTPLCPTCPSTASSHATTVGSDYYGFFSSLAPHISSIYVNEANNWLSGSLQPNTSSPPATETRRVANDSWIGSTAGYDIDVLRRMDLVVARDGVVVCVGSDNATGSSMPTLLSSAYNVITVGNNAGNSSYGPTNIEAAGRVKPDIVAPRLTSYGTGYVSSAAAILLQSLDQLGAYTTNHVAQQQLVKCVLMAGASKSDPLSPNLGTWRKGLTNPSTNGTVPLDYRFGAGELNIDAAHRILTSNPQQIARDDATLTLTGWDYGNLPAGGAARYFIEVPAFNLVQQVSILLVWNRHIAVRERPAFTLTPSLANMDLKFYSAAGFTKGSLIDQSISPIDNVEHIFLRQLRPGRYVFEVTSDAAWDYAIGWDTQLAPTVAPDLNGDGAVDSGDVVIMDGCQTGASAGPPSPACLSADLDGDSDVDLDDFGMLQRCYAGPGVMPDSACYP